MQHVLVIVIVGACVAWLGILGYRFFRPKAGGNACRGGCCAGADKPVKEDGATTARMQMISSQDMRARLKARRG
jgi:hypothetical protein